MAKVIDEPVNLGKSSAKKNELVRDSRTGKLVTVRTVDAHGKTFASDLSRAFKSNVGAALRAKK